jgi:hypothetical protein
MSTANQTHDHQTIKNWVAQRKGVPARVKGTESGDQGVLRVHFPEFSKSDNLEEISWEGFFNDFDQENLDFLYQDKKENGETSTFHKFVTRQSSDRQQVSGPDVIGLG